MNIECIIYDKFSTIIGCDFQDKYVIRFTNLDRQLELDIINKLCNKYGDNSIYYSSHSDSFKTTFTIICSTLEQVEYLEQEFDFKVTYIDQSISSIINNLLLEKNLFGKKITRRAIDGIVNLLAREFRIQPYMFKFTEPNIIEMKYMNERIEIKL